MATFDASKLNFPFMKYRKILVSISLLCIIASAALLLTKGLNLGVDFTGGLVLQVKFDKPVDIAKVRSALSGIGQGNAMIQAFADDDVMLRFQAQEDQVRKDVLAALSSDVGSYKLLRVEKIGPVVGKELRSQAAYSLIIALAGILLYMAYRFRFRFGASPEFPEQSPPFPACRAGSLPVSTKALYSSAVQCSDPATVSASRLSRIPGHPSVLVCFVPDQFLPEVIQRLFHSR